MAAMGINQSISTGRPASHSYRFNGSATSDQMAHNYRNSLAHFTGLRSNVKHQFPRQALVCARASFHADQAQRQFGDQPRQLLARSIGHDFANERPPISQDPRVINRCNYCVTLVGISRFL